MRYCPGSKVTKLQMSYTCLLESPRCPVGPVVRKCRNMSVRHVAYLGLFFRGWTHLGLIAFASPESGLDLQGTNPSQIRKSSDSDLHTVSPSLFIIVKYILVLVHTK